jgi:hypothetical protein
MMRVVQLYWGIACVAEDLAEPPYLLDDAATGTPALWGTEGEARRQLAKYANRRELAVVPVAIDFGTDDDPTPLTEEERT